MPALKHDGILKVAVGHSRFEKKWSNKQTPWSKLVDQLQQTTRTRESIEAYKKMPKKDQDQIKDVGGFVGGVVKGGRRNIGSVNERSLLTLDADHAPSNLDLAFEADVTLGCAAAWYSTHKHTVEHPRLRLVIPLTRPVDADEYQALSRKVAAEIGIDFFDDTTYQPHRLMYWPSTSQDGDFNSGYHDTAWLNPDVWLAKYSDWRDVSEWPFSSRQTQAVHKMAEKQGDPTEKRGIVGAFCRTYNVDDVIEKYLSDQYTPSDKGRYTYAGGSTSSGVLVYQDGAFLYSHHATDPISGQLVNAFDLLRIHKFKELDADTDEKVPIINKPSYKAMAEFAVDDAAVKEQLAKEQIESAEDAFNEDLETDWRQKLVFKANGGLAGNAQNVILILQHDSVLSRKFHFDEFCHRAVVSEDLPWRPASRGRYWNDTDDAGLRNYLSKRYKITGQGIIADAWKEVIQHSAVHPVKEYLASLSWDGVPRVDTLLIDYLGAEDNAYIRAVTRKSLVAAVARIYRPGVKFDNVLVTVGDQGLGKSYILKLLGGEWFNDSLTTVQGKEAYEQLQGSWIMELAELSATRKAEAEAIKHFISKQEDMFRVSYDRHVSIFPRQCVFFGTTNDSSFLRDRTGNRRFWPVRVGERKPKKDLFKDLTTDEINQVWAEAVLYFHDGESLYLDKATENLANEIREIHTEEDPMLGLIQQYLDTPVPDGWDRMERLERLNYLAQEEKDGIQLKSHTCVIEIWVECLGGKENNCTSQSRREIAAALNRISGWEPYENHKKPLRFKNYGPQKAYVRVDKEHLLRKIH